MSDPLVVVCPADAAPGASVDVEADGVVLRVTVPAGVAPGDTFAVEVPRDAGEAGAAECRDELEPRDPIGDAPGGLACLGAELAGERAIVATYFDAAPVEVHGGDVLTAALRAVLKTISRTDGVDALIEAHAAEFADWEPAAEQRLEWHDRFREYVAIVEGGVREALDELDCSEAEFYDYARAHHVESAEAGRLLRRLLATSEYASFGALMREAHERGSLSV
jgi:hypothetical protein